MTDEIESQVMAEETVPKQYLINRLAEKERKHKKELETLRAELMTQAKPAIAEAIQETVQPTQATGDEAMQQAQAVQAANPVQAQAAINPEAAQMAAQQQAQMQQQQQQGMPPQQQMQPPQQGGMPGGMQGSQGSIPIEAVPALFDELKREEQQRNQQQQMKAASDRLAEARMKVVESIHKRAQENPEFAKLMETHGDKLKGDTLSLLIGASRPSEILEKLMSSPELLSEINNSHEVGKIELLNRVGEQLAIEQMKNMTPTGAGTFATRQTTGAGGEKSMQNMTTAELREHYKKGKRY